MTEPVGYAPITVTTANAPETAKRGLILPRLKRARRVLAWGKRQGVTVFGVQESGTHLIQAARSIGMWAQTYAPPQYRTRNGERGVGIVYRPGRLELLDSLSLGVDHIDDRAPKRIQTGRVWAHVALFRHRSRDKDKRARFVVITLHNPWRLGDVDGSARRRLTRRVRAYVRLCHMHGLPVVLLADGNDGRYGDKYPELVTAAHRGVDWILVSPSIERGRSWWQRLQRLSDHPWGRAKLRIPNNPWAARRLPGRAESRRPVGRTN